jgi:tetratricopeptide (TPR) repeat protein
MRRKSSGVQQWRVLGYVGAAAVIGLLVLAINRPGHRPPQAAMDVDPKVAVHQGRHEHEKLGTACLCDPEAEIKQALQDRADFAATHRDLGDRFYARGQYEYALGRYQRAVELDETNAQAYYGLGLVYTKLGRYAKAEEAMRRAADLAPQMVEPRISLGILAYRAGAFGEAGRYWETALKIDRGNEYARTLLGKLPRLERTSD